MKDKRQLLSLDTIKNVSKKGDKVYDVSWKKALSLKVQIKRNFLRNFFQAPSPSQLLLQIG